MAAGGLWSATRRVTFAAGLAIFAGAASVASAAVQFTGGFEVSALSSDPGLVVKTAKVAQQLNFSLAGPGAYTYINLFDIWTDERTANFSDDFTPAEIRVDFSFSAPLSSGSVTGTTVAGTILIASAGVLTWDHPTEINFGDGGRLWVSLTDEIFNGGLGLGLTPGRSHGARVQAKFKLKSEPLSVVPLPAMLPAFAVAVSSFALIRRRRSAAA